MVVWKPRPTTSCPDKTRWFGTSMWQIRSGGGGHIPIPSKAVNPTQTTIHLPNVYSWEILSFLAGLTTLVVSFLCDPAAKKRLGRNLPHVQYELYDACLARDPVTALNKMGRDLRFSSSKCFFYWAKQWFWGTLWCPRNPWPFWQMAISSNCLRGIFDLDMFEDGGGYPIIRKAETWGWSLEIRTPLPYQKDPLVGYSFGTDSDSAAWARWSNSGCLSGRSDLVTRW